MNPDPWQMLLIDARTANERAANRSRVKRLHDAAMVRRKKRKRGGKK